MNKDIEILTDALESLIAAVKILSPLLIRDDTEGETEWRACDKAIENAEESLKEIT